MADKPIPLKGWRTNKLAKAAFIVAVDAAYCLPAIYIISPQSTSVDLEVVNESTNLGKVEFSQGLDTGMQSLAATPGFRSLIRAHVIDPNKPLIVKTRIVTHGPSWYLPLLGALVFGTAALTESLLRRKPPSL
ncbi:MAG TPA: hypothetical protein VGL56_15395 [Fimbriimonadaceae bacterium]